MIERAVEDIGAEMADAEGVAVGRRARDAADAEQPAAPATFSTTTGCPRVTFICSLSSRAMVSAGPPGPKGTIKVIGRFG